MLSCLAPMDGITDCAYRIICKEIFDKYKNPADELGLRTEFMSADGYVHNPVGVVKHLMTTDNQSVIAQIFGGEKESLVACARDIDAKYKFQAIELNMGCPSPKIYSCAAGSGMLRDKAYTLDIIKTIAGSITTPFSIKTRVGLNKEDQVAQLQFLLDAAPFVSTITIHGRTFGQSHAGEVNRDFIYRLKEQLPNHIIIGNGGLRTYQDGQDKLGNLDGMMRGQSAIGNPWILTPHTPTLEERYETIMHHIHLIILCEINFTQQKSHRSGTLGVSSYEEFIEQEKNILTIISRNNYDQRCLLEFRKYLFGYINGLARNKILKQNIVHTKTYEELIKCIEEYFNSIVLGDSDEQ